MKAERTSTDSEEFVRQKFALAQPALHRTYDSDWLRIGEALSGAPEYLLPYRHPDRLADSEAEAYGGAAHNGMVRVYVADPSGLPSANWRNRYQDSRAAGRRSPA